MMNKLKKGFVIVAMAGMICSVNGPATEVSAATRNCATAVAKNCTIGKTFHCGKLKYKVTGKNSVTCIGFCKNSKSAKSCSIPSKVTCNGKTYKVTKVANNAFSNCKKLNRINCSNQIANCSSNCFGGAIACFR